MKIELPVKDLIYELNKIGTNINQIAHKVNMSGSITNNDVIELSNLTKEMYIKMRKELFEYLSKLKV